MHVLFVLSNILGNKTFSNQILTIVKNLKDVDPTILTLDDNDYQKYKVNKILRMSNFLESFFVIRKKYKQLNSKHFDIIFLQGIGLVPVFKKIIKKIPTILAHDSTPRLSIKLTLDDDKKLIKRIIYIIKEAFYYCLYSAILKKVKVFLPRTAWCAESLINDYKICKDIIIKSPVSLDLNKWKPLQIKNNDKKVLLFIGNDFYRKGGDFIIRIYEKYFSETTILKIISNDNEIKKISIPKGVQVISGFNDPDNIDYINLYQTSDIMVLPTKHDFLPIALIEAVSVGLPIIASNIGAVKEAVQNNENGFLCSYKMLESEWADRISLLVNDERIRSQFGLVSRSIALKKFNIEMLIQNINDAINIAKNSMKNEYKKKYNLKKRKSKLC